MGNFAFRLVIGLMTMAMGVSEAYIWFPSSDLFAEIIARHMLSSGFCAGAGVAIVVAAFGFRNRENKEAGAKPE